MNTILQEILELFGNFIEHGASENAKLFESCRCCPELEDVPEFPDVESDDEVSRPEFGQVVLQLIVGVVRDLCQPTHVIE